MILRAGLLLLLSAAPAFSNVIIKVRDRSGQPVAGAWVCNCEGFNESVDGSRAVQQTDADGFAYFIQGSSSAAQHVLVSSAGYGPSLESQYFNYRSSFTAGTAVIGQFLVGATWYVTLDTAPAGGGIDVPFTAVPGSVAMGRLEVAGKPGVAVAEGFGQADGAGNGSLSLVNVPFADAGNYVALVSTSLVHQFQENLYPMKHVAVPVDEPVASAAVTTALADLRYAAKYSSSEDPALGPLFEHLSVLGRFLSSSTTYPFGVSGTLKFHGCGDSRTTETGFGTGNVFRLYNLLPHTTYYAELVADIPELVVASSAPAESVRCGVGAPAPDANGFVYEGGLITRDFVFSAGINAPNTRPFYVRVRDSSGHPVPEGWVTLASDTAAWTPTGGGAPSADPAPASYKTAIGLYQPDGVAEFHDPSPGNYLVRAFTPFSSRAGVLFGDSGNTGTPLYRVTSSTGRVVSIYGTNGVLIATNSSSQPIIITLPPSAGAKIKGTLTFIGGGSASGQSLPVKAMAADGSAGGGFALIDAPFHSGTPTSVKTIPFEVSVATGHRYVLDVSAYAQQWGIVSAGGARTEINLEETSTTSLNIVLAPSNNIAGRLYTPYGLFNPTDPSATDDGSQVEVQAVGASSWGRAVVGPDGHFIINGLLPGSHRLLLSGSRGFPYVSPVEPAYVSVLTPGYGLSDDGVVLGAFPGAYVRPSLSTSAFAPIETFVDPACTTLACQPERWVVHALPAGSRLTTAVLRRFLNLSQGDDAHAFINSPSTASAGYGCDGIRSSPETGWCYGAVAGPAAYDFYALRQGLYDEAYLLGQRPYFVLAASTKAAAVDASLMTGTAADAADPLTTRGVEDVALTPLIPHVAASAYLTGSATGAFLLRKQDFDQFGGDYRRFLNYVPVAILYDSSGALSAGGALVPDPWCVHAVSTGLANAAAQRDFVKFAAAFNTAVACSGDKWTFQIRGLNPGATYTMVLTGPNYLPYQRKVVTGGEGSLTQLPTVALDSVAGGGASLNLLMRTPAGAAIPYAVATVSAPNYPARAFTAGPDGKVNAAAGGIRGLPAGNFGIEASATGYSRSAINLAISTTAAARGTVFSAVLTLPVTGTPISPGGDFGLISGKIFRATMDGVVPLVGADVYAYDEGQSVAHGGEPNFALPLYKAVTDSSGQYSFAGLPSGSYYRVFAHADGFLSANTTTGQPFHYGTADFTLAPKPLALNVSAALAGSEFSFSIANPDVIRSASAWVGPVPFDLSVATPVVLASAGDRQLGRYAAAALDAGVTYSFHVDAQTWDGAAVTSEISFGIDASGHAIQAIDRQIIGDERAGGAGLQNNQVPFNGLGENNSLITFPPGAVIPVSTTSLPACTITQTDPLKSSSAAVVGSTEAFASGVYDIGLSSVNFTDLGFDITLAYNPTDTVLGDLDVYVFLSTDLASDLGIAGVKRPAGLSLCVKGKWCSATNLGLTTVLDPLHNTLTLKKIKSLTSVLSARGPMRALSTPSGFHVNPASIGWKGEKGSFAVMKTSKIRLGGPALAVAVEGVSSMTWSWNADPNAIGYAFQPSTGGAPILLTGRDTVSLTLPGLSTNTFYAGRIASLNGAEPGLYGPSTGAFTLAAAPLGLDAADVQASSITIAWSTNTNPSGTKYVLRRSLSTAILTLNSTDTFVAKGLLPNTSYTFTLLALNGDRKPTEVLSLSTTTLRLKPSAAPALRAVGVDTQTVLWNWTAVSGAAGAESYLFFPSTWPAGQFLETTSTFVAISDPAGMTANTPWSGKVRVKNANGFGPLSAAVTGYTTAAAPFALAATAVNITSVSVSWDNAGNPAGTRFVLSRWLATGATTPLTVTETALSASTGAAMTGLLANATYHFNVRAMNAKSALTAYDPAVEVVARTLPAKPTAVPALTAAGADTQTVTWTWNAITGPAGASSYLFYPSTWPAGQSLETFGTSVTLGDPAMATNTPWSGKVRIKNAFGLGPLSAAVTGYTLAAAPGPISIAAVNTTSITVTWDTAGNPSGTRFLLSHWTVGGSTPLPNVVAMPVAMPTVTSVVTALLANTTYFFNVQAQNAKGIKAPLALDPALEGSAKTRVSASVASVSAARPAVSTAAAAAYVVAGEAYGGAALRLTAYPNPFALGLKTPALKDAFTSTMTTNGTVILIQVPSGFKGASRLRILTRAGALVRDLDLGVLPGGFDYYAEWDGRNKAGVNVAPGPYLGVFSMAGVRRSAVIKLTVSAPPPVRRSPLRPR